MKTRTSLFLSAVLIAAALLSACGNAPAASSTPEGDAVPRKGDKMIPTDYSNADNWIVTSEAILPVDVFLLYPTTYSAGTDGPPVATIEDSEMRAGAQNFVANKGSAFETAGNLFAPYYRQLDAAFTLAQTPEDVASFIGGVPATDAIAAFEYYLEHYNQGRPFILVSHSQGSSVAKELLFSYFKEHEELCRRMVAAYVIGYAVTEEELEANPHLKFAEGPDDTGVIISYNTLTPDFEGTLTTLLPGAIAINPITWTREGTPAAASESLGAFVDRGDGYERVPHLADAVVDPARGVVLCSTVDPALYAMPEALYDIFGKGSLHGNDISLYYYDLRANAENRVEKYLGSSRA